MYRRLSADRLFIMGKMWLEKHSFVCDFWVERSRVLLCILVKPEVVIWSLKMFLPTAQPSFITVHGCWRLIPKAWLEDFTDVRSFRFPLCETYSSVSWLKQGLFGLLVWSRSQRDLSNMQHRLIVLLYAVWSCLVTFQRPALNQEELWKFTRTWDIIFLVRTWCLLSTELWFGVWCALQLVDNSLQRRWAATGGINK